MVAVTLQGGKWGMLFFNPGGATGGDVEAAKTAFYTWGERGRRKVREGWEEEQPGARGGGGKREGRQAVLYFPTTLLSL